MAITLSTRPAAWTAIKNPAVYTFLREDNTIVSADNNGAGKLRLQITGDVTANYLDGDDIIILNTAHTVYYIGAVVGNSTFGGGVTQIVTGLNYTSGRDTDATSGFVNNISRLESHRIEVDIYKSADDLRLNEDAGGTKFTYSADKYGIVRVYIDAVVRSYLEANWTDPSATNEIETLTSLAVYIKYQELYEGSAVGQVDDVANPIIAVYAAQQIHFAGIKNSQGSNLTDYVPASSSKKYLTRFRQSDTLDTLRMWRSQIFSLSFIYPSGLGSLICLVEQYNAAGTFIKGTSATLASNPGFVNRLDFLNFITIDDAATTLLLNIGTVGAEILVNPGFTGALAPWSNVAGSKPDWTYNANTATTTLTLANSQSDVLRQDGSGGFLAQTEGVYKLEYTASWDDVTVIEYIFIYPTPVAGTVIKKHIESLTGSGANVTNTKYFRIPSDFDRLDIVATHNGVAATNVIIENSISLKKLTRVFNEQEIIIEESCSDAGPDNLYQLFWKNSLGGDAWYCFKYGQQYTYNYGGGKKAQRLILFAEHITYIEWEALNELNNTADIIKKNIQSFTSTTDKTSFVDNQQVLLFSASLGAVPIGVIVIPRQSTINTKDTLHNFEVEIELPEVFL